MLIENETFYIKKSNFHRDYFLPGVLCGWLIVEEEMKCGKKESKCVIVDDRSTC